MPAEFQTIVQWNGNTPDLFYKVSRLFTFEKSSNSQNVLFKPLKISENLSLNNRIAMAPLTRQRAETDGTPNELLTEHYSQRASYGLIITECAPVDIVGNGFLRAGAIYNKKQVEGWKKVTESVHKKGGKIIMQIWHAGRAAHSEINGGNQVVSSSGIAIRGKHLIQKEYETPKQLSKEEIRQVVAQYTQGALNAVEAGFDGVQLHGANGYLIDQFLKESSNDRTDEYGGSVDRHNFSNRINNFQSRFLLEIIDSIAKVMPVEDLSVRLSPTGRFADQYDSNPIALMEYLLPQLEKRKLGFVELKRHNMLERKGGAFNQNDKTKQGVEKAKPEDQIPDFFRTLRKYYKGILMGNDGLNPESAKELIEEGVIDLVSFGTLAITNPDLPERILNNFPLNKNNEYATYYYGDEKGYTTYQRYENEIKSKI
ncbi:hypothetical protein PPERSA_01488 [Pseudocohnilembus persalinus]|uniref:NADH:flavin oxidoreductase/NADH oxidase N-terminal domain-containing protein n=1 Tax=Pseudocohnilembus persalinus TaxID=266149 RepID=A0A0V0QH62_PSEPJ|nr:hypothetical protein PPERSA_01488 [Pseudocohnilembus persalinus]|eukprot:KRX01585.1 hypothetical protein PPERSA_01488 [Pseudocohnilembus persalinus]